MQTVKSGHLFERLMFGQGQVRETDALAWGDGDLLKFFHVMAHLSYIKERLSDYVVSGFLHN